MTDKEKLTATGITGIILIIVGIILMAIDFILLGVLIFIIGVIMTGASYIGYQQDISNYQAMT